MLGLGFRHKGAATVCNATRRESESDQPVPFQCPSGSMEEQAVIAERPPLIIPSPVDDTDSDEQAPQSAQDPSVQAEHGGNSDNGKGETISGPNETVHDDMVQIAGGDEPLHPACLAQLAEEDGEDHVNADTDSELEDGARKRRRNRHGVRRARIPWRTLEVIDRSQHSDEEIQIRLNELACTLYEKAGTSYPPGLLSFILIQISLRFASVY
jgi:hypothetical protein